MFKRKANKYRNNKVVVDGVTFDSKAEAKRWGELKALQAAKMITTLSRQPRFILMDGYRDTDGKWIRPITYSGDFRYIDENGSDVVEDVKSWITARDKVYKLKVKLFHQRYPSIKFKEVVM